jgi:hypothetical protein
VRRWLIGALVAASISVRGGLAAVAPLPVLFQSAPGRFEVAAVDAMGAQRVVGLAEEAWRLLAGPLILPESFPSPVFVRLVPAQDWREGGPFRVIVEAGGVVSVRVRWEEAVPENIVQRALVQGLLMRQAVARHGVHERLAAPLWLEHACAGWWLTRAEPAQLDALKQASERRTPPSLKDLLAWQRGATEPPELSEGAVWLLTLLVGENTRAGEWPALLHRLLGGENPDTALATTFSGRFADESQRELWWMTAWHHLCRARVLPGWEAADSRAELRDLARFVFARDGVDVVVPLAEVLSQASEAAVDAERKRRAAVLNHILPSLHPFYRNAALSLAEAVGARGINPEKGAALVAAFENDWRDATDLDAASTRALDAWERARR